MTQDFDVEQFKEIFVQEAKEHLITMNKCLLELEKTPKDKKLLNDIFRPAHTMKGMAATMGFEKITQLSHSMENVLDDLREGKVEPSNQIVDILFDCFDALELLVEEVISNQSKEVDVNPLVAKLKALADKGAAAGPADQKKTILVPNQQAASVQNEKVEEIDEKLIKAPEVSSTATEPAEEKTQAVCDSAYTGDERRHATADDSKSQTVRVKVEHLDKLMNLVGEMVIAKAQMYQVAERWKISDLDTVINIIGQTSKELQEEVLKTRMVPVKQIFDRFPRMVRDLTKKLDKEINFEMTGTEIEVDRMLLEQINEPLVHLLRNAIDHGIELPADRKKNGKNPAGKVLLNAKREKGFVWIEVSDDGKGIDPVLIRQKAIEKGIITLDTARTLNDIESLLLICHPGFSLAEKVTDISGRGVGMDVVKNLVETFNGKLEIKSEKGKGSMFVVKLPLTLAIIQALVVRSGDENYSIPLTHVAEIARLEPDFVKTIEKNEVFLLRNEVIPIIRLSRFFDTKASKSIENENYVVIIEMNDKKLGIVVDDMLGKHEVVIKTFAGILKNVKNFSGATIMGDGRVLLIVDVASISGS